MVYLVFYIITTLLGIIFIKLGSESLNFMFSFSKIKFEIGIFSVIGLAFYVVSFLLWITVLKEYELSWVVPLTTGITQILILIAAVTIFKEDVNFYRILGIIVIILGLFLLNIKK